MTRGQEWKNCDEYDDENKITRNNHENNITRNNDENKIPRNSDESPSNDDKDIDS